MAVNVSTVEEAVTYAKKDLAKRLDIPANAIKVLEHEEATWPDASLGMPEPGQMYAQMLTEGYRIIIEAEGKQYQYHFGNGTVKTRPTKR